MGLKVSKNGLLALVVVFQGFKAVMRVHFLSKVLELALFASFLISWTHIKMGLHIFSNQLCGAAIEGAQVLSEQTLVDMRQSLIICHLFLFAVLVFAFELHLRNKVINQLVWLQKPLFAIVGAIDHVLGDALIANELSAS